MNEEENKKWFKKSGFLQWYPVSWEGWLVITLISLAILASFFFGQIELSMQEMENRQKHILELTGESDHGSWEF